MKGFTTAMIPLIRASSAFALCGPKCDRCIHEKRPNMALRRGSACQRHQSQPGGRGDTPTRNGGGVPSAPRCLHEGADIAMQS